MSEEQLIELRTALDSAEMTYRGIQMTNVADMNSVDRARLDLRAEHARREAEAAAAKYDAALKSFGR